MIRIFHVGKQTKSKYGNVRTEYNGKIYDSRAEANWAQTLDNARFAKDPKEKVVAIEEQVKYPLYVNEELICNYIADFVVDYADGRKEVQDVKGFKTKEYQLKKKLFKAIFQREIKEIEL